MNTKIKLIIASGLLLATAAPIAACAGRAPAAKPIPTTNAAIIDVKPVEETTTETEVETTYETTIADPVGAPVEKLVEQETEQTTAAKKTTKKTTKKTKKTTKKSKKTNKKSGKKSTAAKFTYGSSKYTAKNITISVFIKKDNTVNVTVVNNRPNKSDKAYFTYEFSGKINPNTGLFTYSNGSIKSVIDAHIRQERTMYRNNASGYMTFNGNNLTWFDGALHCADNVTFHKQ